MAEIRDLWLTAKELLGEDELSRRFRLWINNLIRTAKLKGQNKAMVGRYDAEIHEILQDLNERAKRRFQASEPAKAMIIARIKEGATVSDFKAVHEVKVRQWYGDEKTESWIRPSTLYRPSKFWEYLAQADGEDQKKRELAKKRRSAQMPIKEHAIEDTERKAIIDELMQKDWDSFGTWREFMLWTIRFPDAESLAAYPMPERIREMRRAPNMLRMIATNKPVEWAEAEYREIKERCDVCG